MSETQNGQERNAVRDLIWKIATELRGSIDGWDFKQYVLGMLFYRFISENLTTYVNEKQKEAKIDNFNYADISDSDAETERNTIRDEKGFFIRPSELFENVLKNATDDEDLNETLENVFKNIEASAKDTNSEDDIKGLFDDLDVNSNKLGATVEKRNKRLAKILEKIDEMPIENYKNNSIDVFGEAYENLMSMYAADAGKSGGEFFTPQGVSELLAKITVVGKEEINKVYDPACGSGSLLLQFTKIFDGDEDKVRNGFFGQEINLTTYNLCRINMFLHDINYGQFDIAHGDTLTEPEQWDGEPFEAIVSNPPYSINWDGDSNQILINDERFNKAGVLAPKSKADLAFVMHSLSYLATNGTAAIVCFPGVMSRGGAEKKIRKYLVDNNYVDAVIQLPKNLFFGTTIDTCILVLKKNKSKSEILFINAAKEFVHVSPKNEINEKNITNILNCYKKRKNIDKFSKLVDHEIIKENQYNISVGMYVDSKDIEEEIDIKKVSTVIKKTVLKQKKLREKIDVLVAEIKGG